MSKIADTLRCAANKHLSAGPVVLQATKWEYTCDAVGVAHDGKAYSYTPAHSFLNKLGVDTYSTRQFDEFSFGQERQAVRYAWLMFAADVAEEFGLD